MAASIPPFSISRSTSSLLSCVARNMTALRLDCVRAVPPAGSKESSFVADIASGASLKAVETVDKSAPVIEKDVKIGENPFKKVASDLVQPHALKPAETVDKSAPMIDKAVKIGSNNRAELMSEITSVGAKAA